MGAGEARPLRVLNAYVRSVLRGPRNGPKPRVRRSWSRVELVGEAVAYKLTVPVTVAVAVAVAVACGGVADHLSAHKPEHTWPAL